jgi:hypothetical protein
MSIVFVGREVPWFKFLHEGSKRNSLAISLPNGFIDANLASNFDVSPSRYEGICAEVAVILISLPGKRLSRLAGNAIVGLIL